jgi:hypothetical protein
MFVCYLAADIFSLKGHPSLNSKKPFSAFNSNKIGFDG